MVGTVRLCPKLVETLLTVGYRVLLDWNVKGNYMGRVANLT